MGRGWRAGQRVIVFPGFSCGACEYCLKGKTRHCAQQQTVMILAGVVDLVVVGDEDDDVIALSATVVDDDAISWQWTQIEGDPPPHQEMRFGSECEGFRMTLGR